jgi:hypothetical protein
LFQISVTHDTVVALAPAGGRPRQQLQIMSLLSCGSNDHEMIGAIGRSGETMARSAGATTLAQPLPGSERAGPITINVVFDY